MPRRRSGGLALLGALAGVALLVALAFALLSGGDDSNRRRAGAQPTATATPRAKKKQKQSARTTATPTPTATASAAPPSSGTGNLQQATQLQIAGYNARRAGDYSKAITFSQQALEACGSSGPLSPCGYAAYEMGYSLNHTGRPAEAIPFLERRLAYGENSEARAELADARRNAAGGSSGDSGNSGGHGRGDKKRDEG